MITKTKIIALITVWLASVLFSVYITKNYVEGQAAKGKVEAFEQVIEKLNVRSDQDFNEAVSRAKTEGAAAERARLARSKGVEDAARKANPACDRDDESLGLLINAIDAASGTKPTGGLRDRMQTDPKAAGKE